MKTNSQTPEEQIKETLKSLPDQPTDSLQVEASKALAASQNLDVSEEKKRTLKPTPIAIGLVIITAVASIFFSGIGHNTNKDSLSQATSKLDTFNRYTAIFAAIFTALAVTSGLLYSRTNRQLSAVKDKEAIDQKQLTAEANERAGNAIERAGILENV
jgi:preprotein translocase subunit SecG